MTQKDTKFVRLSHLNIESFHAVVLEHALHRVHYKEHYQNKPQYKMFFRNKLEENILLNFWG